MKHELASQEFTLTVSRKLSGFLRTLFGAMVGILFFTILLLPSRLTHSSGTLISLLLFLPGLIVLNVLQVSSSGNKDLWDVILYSVSYIPSTVVGMLIFSARKTIRDIGFVLLGVYFFLSLCYGLYAGLILSD